MKDLHSYVEEQIESCLKKDRRRLTRLYQQTITVNTDKRDVLVRHLQQDLATVLKWRQSRIAGKPRIAYPTNL